MLTTTDSLHMGGRQSLRVPAFGVAGAEQLIYVKQWSHPTWNAYRLMPVHETTLLGRDVRIFHPELVNLYGCHIGSETQIGAFVEVQRGASIGARCKIQSHSFICEGVTIEDEVFVGHGVMFTNDIDPRATDDAGRLARSGDWTLARTRVQRRASIGSGATILPVNIGVEALIGAGAVVTKDVRPYSIVAGNPAVEIGDVRQRRDGPARA